MYKLLLLLVCTLVVLAQPQVNAAALAGRSTTDVEMVDSTPSHRPSFKKYRGNSRHKAKRLGAFRRWALWRKAQRKRKKAGPVIKVGVPVRRK